MTVEDTSLKLPLTTHEVLSDPYGGFSRLREETRIARGMWDGGPAWFITRYDDVNAVLHDRRFATNYRSAGGIDTYADVLTQLGISPEHVPYLADSLVYTDAP